MQTARCRFATKHAALVCLRRAAFYHQLVHGGRKLLDSAGNVADSAQLGTRGTQHNYGWKLLNMILHREILVFRRTFLGLIKV